MNAWKLVASWAEDRVKLWRHDAQKARVAYSTNPMAEACGAYAEALEKAATQMEIAMHCFRDSATVVDREAGERQGKAGP